mmetsp:Transcript_13817/g.23801  ORF Transcript_13817/g.23801 Transcript_13817/m.23801 type:complete len:488 (-) Transcript_13817:49-1512(-)
MGLLGKLNFWKKPKVSAVQPLQPVILEEVSPEAPRQELRPHCVQQDTIREVEEGVVSEAPTSSRGAEVNRCEAVRPSQVQPKISFDDTDTRTPSPSECGDPDSLNFDAKAEHTYLGITKEFGHMIGSSLQSNKWDRRCQALKSMLQVLKGLDLEGMAPPGSTGVLGSLRPRDPVKRWRLTCQLLHHVIRDKVMPVRLAALDLYQQAFSDLECFEKAEVVYACGVLVEHLIDRLGDSNVRLHEAARRCLIFTAEKPRLGPKVVLERLREKLTACRSERAKVYFGVLDSVLALLEHFDQEVDVNESYSAEELAPFILVGLDDSGSRVRSCAVQLAGHIYATHGPDVMEPILQKLRPAKQALLRSKFQEIDEEAAPDEDDAEEGEERPDLDGFLIGHAPVAACELDHSPSSEESLMDGILEDAGLVFQGQGIIHEDLDKELDDSWLEEELLGFCVESPGMDEQQALMSLLEEVSPQAAEGRQSDLSVEVF